MIVLPQVLLSLFVGAWCVAWGNLKADASPGQEAGSSKGFLVLKKDSSNSTLDCFPELTFGVSNFMIFKNLPFKCYSFWKFKLPWRNIVTEFTVIFTVSDGLTRQKHQLLFSLQNTFQISTFDVASLGHKQQLSGSSEKNFLPSIITDDSLQKQCDLPAEKGDLGMSHRLNLTIEM